MRTVAGLDRGHDAVAQFLGGDAMDLRVAFEIEAERAFNEVDELLGHLHLAAALGERAQAFVLALEQGDLVFQRDDSPIGIIVLRGLGSAAPLQTLHPTGGGNGCPEQPGQECLRTHEGRREKRISGRLPRD
ncbi:MAG: hypothetical protein EON93_23185 [Burkholderiales bacterium]|nr:MAG: hypothetical protein EON93_23185 [Burkholderiales bacterium]